MQNPEFKQQVEAQWAVIQAELIELVRDIKYNEKCVCKYGQITTDYIDELKVIKDKKLTKLIKLRDAAMKVNITLEQTHQLIKELQD